jgi:HK97 family phage prohead protease
MAIEYRRASQYSPSAGQAGPRPIQPGSEGDILFSALVVPWNSRSENLGQFVEEVRPGAFTKSLASGANIPLLVDHERKIVNVMADTQSGSLQLAETDEGLVLLARGTNSQTARDVAAAIQNCHVGMSFAFICQRQQMSTLPDGTRLRTVLEADLDEVSIVQSPAYPATKITAVFAENDARRSAVLRSHTSYVERERPTAGYLRAKLDLDDLEFRIANERRANPHHDEAGKFHDGSPAKLLAAAQGRMVKAAERHGAACRVYRAAVEQYGPDHYDTLNAKQSWMEARIAHQAAIEGADVCAADVSSQLRALIDDHKQKWASQEYANPAAMAQASSAPVM